MNPWIRDLLHDLAGTVRIICYLIIGIVCYELLLFALRLF